MSATLFSVLRTHKCYIDQDEVADLVTRQLMTMHANRHDAAKLFEKFLLLGVAKLKTVRLFR